MSDSLVTTLRDELQSLLAPLFNAVGDVGARRRLLHALGADDTLADDEALLSALQAADDLRRQIDQIADAPPESFTGIVALLQASSNLFAVVRALGHTRTPALARLGSDIVALLTGNYVRAEHPLLYRFSALLTLVEPVGETPPMAGVSVDGQVVRAPFAYARIRFDRLSALMHDPAGTLRLAYLARDLATVADANATADALFPRIGAILTELGVIWSYGIPDEDLAMLGDATPFVDHAFQLRVPTSLAGDGVEAGVVFTLSSADRGDLGLVLSPFGTLKFSKQVGQWLLEASLSADVQALALGRHGVTVLASASTTSIEGNFSASLVPETAGAPAFVFGSATGTRLEFGSAKLAISIDVSGGDATVALSAGVESSALVVAPGDGDGFLRSVLPADGLQAQFDLGIAWSNERGLTFRGAAGLEATLPVGISIGGTLTVPTIHLSLQASDAGLLAEVSASAGLSIGPIQALIDRVGIMTAVTFPEAGGNLGVADLDFHFKSPSGVGLVVDAAGVSGGGFLAHDEATHEYRGVLQLEFTDLALQAFGLITTQVAGGSGYSLLALIDAEFPPVQLGWGFTLNGVGGLLAVHRTASVDALRAALKADQLSTILFPKHALTNAPQILGQLDALFPPAPGRFLFGPMAQIGWGTPPVLTASLAIILEWPEPIRLVLLARLALRLPAPSQPLVRINMDALGVLDLSQSEFALDATLYDSRLLSFALTGDMALRATWGSQRAFLLAVGGFHPRFAPPAGFPPLKRLTIDMPSGIISTLRLQAYLAITSNTLQFGARLDVFIGVSEFGLAGHLGFDALLQRDPFHFDADISGSVELTAGGESLMAVGLDATLSGPAPWNIAGSFTFSILFWDVHVSFSQSWGEEAAEPPRESVDIAQLLGAILAAPHSWGAHLPEGIPALVSARSRDDGALVVHPLARLEVHEPIVPLGLEITHFGAAVPSGARRFAITEVRIGGATVAPEFVESVEDDFAPAQFFDLSEEEKLAGPSFERHEAGVRVGGGPVVVSSRPAITKDIAYETWFIDTPNGTIRPPDSATPVLTLWMESVIAGGAADRAALPRAGRRKYRVAGRGMTVAEPAFVVVDARNLALAQIASAAGATYSDVRAALDEALSRNPQRRGQLAIVARHEVGAA